MQAMQALQPVRPRTQDSAEQLTANDQAPGRRFCALLEAPANPLPSKAPPPLGAIRLLARVLPVDGQSAMQAVKLGGWMAGGLDGGMDSGRVPLPGGVDPVPRILAPSICSFFLGLAVRRRLCVGVSSPFYPHLSSWNLNRATLARPHPTSPP